MSYISSGLPSLSPSTGSSEIQKPINPLDNLAAKPLAERVHLPGQAELSIFPAVIRIGRAASPIRITPLNMDDSSRSPSLSSLPLIQTNPSSPTSSHSASSIGYPAVLVDDAELSSDDSFEETPPATPSPFKLLRSRTIQVLSTVGSLPTIASRSLREAVISSGGKDYIAQREENAPNSPKLSALEARFLSRFFSETPAPSIQEESPELEESFVVDPKAVKPPVLERQQGSRQLVVEPSNPPLRPRSRSRLPVKGLVRRTGSALSRAG